MKDKKREGFITKKIRERCEKEVIKYSAISFVAGFLIATIIKR